MICIVIIGTVDDDADELSVLDAERANGARANKS